MSSHFHPLRVIEVTRDTADAVVLTLAPAEPDGAPFAFAPGQHLTLRADIAGEDVRRNYSLCVAPGEGLRVAVKRVAGGRFSTWVTQALARGDVIEAMPPRGHFTWDFAPAAARRYVMIAGGSGITPILSLLRTGLAREPLSQFTLLYGNCSSGAIMFLEELAALKDRYIDRFQLYHFLTAEADDVVLFNGRLDAHRLAQVLGSLVDPAHIDAAFICGPGAMMDAAERALVEAGVDPAAVLVERFTTGEVSGEALAQVRAASEAAAGTPIAVTMDGRRRTIAFAADQGNILDSARAAGLPAPFACKAGVCATCRARLVSGEVRMAVNYGLSADEVAAGYILTCQAVPVGEGVAIDYDA